MPRQLSVVIELEMTTCRSGDQKALDPRRFGPARSAPGSFFRPVRPAVGDPGRRRSAAGNLAPGGRRWQAVGLGKRAQHAEGPKGQKAAGRPDRQRRPCGGEDRDSDEIADDEIAVKNPITAAHGRKGALKWGKARADKLSSDERRAIAKRDSCWMGKIAIYGEAVGTGRFIIIAS
jgi:hypothetical protein